MSGAMMTVFVRLLHPCYVFFFITAHLGIIDGVIVCRSAARCDRLTLILRYMCTRY